MVFLKTWRTFLSKQSKKLQYSYYRAIANAIIKTVIKIDKLQIILHRLCILLALSPFMHIRTWMWLDLNCTGLVWFHTLASWQLLFFYIPHDIPCPNAQKLVQPISWLFPGCSVKHLRYCLFTFWAKIEKKDTETSFTSPFKYTAEQKKDNRKRVSTSKQPCVNIQTKKKIWQDIHFINIILIETVNIHIN